MKVSIMLSQLRSLAPILAALGYDVCATISVPQGNKYDVHQGNKEKARRLKKLAKGLNVNLDDLV